MIIIYFCLFRIIGFCSHDFIVLLGLVRSLMKNLSWFALRASFIDIVAIIAFIVEFLERNVHLLYEFIFLVSVEQTYHYFCVLITVTHSIQFPMNSSRRNYQLSP